MRYTNMSFLVYFIIVSFTLISTTHYVDAKRSLSNAEEDDIVRQLKVLNKKPVKTIKTEIGGDIIDCIDIYKQPAFDNPLLKNHKIQMNPNSIPGDTTISSSELNRASKGCPLGTVPIRRTTRDDLVNAKKIIQKNKLLYANNTYPNPMATQFVFAEEVIEGKRYYGGRASISLHDLTVYRNESSTSQIWIVNGPLNGINVIEIGIRHDPSLFGDNHIRLYGSWTADGYQSTGCLNTLCPGFYQVSPSITFGHEFRSSVYGRVSVSIHLMIYRAMSGNWWLSMGHTAESTDPIGYWPKELFTDLENGASMLRFGGFASAPSGRSTPPMGNGFLPQLNDYTRTAYMAKMKYIDENRNSINLDSQSIQTQKSTSPECYDLMYAGNMGEGWDITMVYGGPGGLCV